MTRTLERREIKENKERRLAIRQDDVFYLINEDSGVVIRVLAVEVVGGGTFSKLRVKFPHNYMLLQRREVSEHEANLLEEYRVISEEDVRRIRDKYPAR